jgi:putative membrane protein
MVKISFNKLFSPSSQNVENRLPKNFQKKLQEQIEKIESESRVEFVTAFAERSSDFKEFRNVYSLYILILLLLIQRASHVFYWGAFSEWLFSLSVAFVFYLFWEKYPSSLLKLIPKKSQFKACELKAKEIFFDQEIFATEKRSGILIFVSFAEKSVIILADKGFRDQISESVWTELSMQLAQDFDADNPGQTFLKALESFRGKFQEIFPITDGENPNELSNKLRT